MYNTRTFRAAKWNSAIIDFIVTPALPPVMCCLSLNNGYCLTL